MGLRTPNSFAVSLKLGYIRIDGAKNRSSRRCSDGRHVFPAEGIREGLGGTSYQRTADPKEKRLLAGLAATHVGLLPDRG